jgi:type II secretory pathway predicted ATPase ExeA
MLAAEDNDAKGKTLKSTHIAEAILAAVAPLERPKQSSEARFAQLHKCLKESHNSSYKHCLIIEEAHSLPIPTLKHLKRIYELELGYTKLVSIILIGQPELLEKLSERNAQVREFVQRCEVATLTPIDVANLGDFINHRVGRLGKKTADIIDDTGISEIVKRLCNRNGASQLYPLAVGNFLVAAMNLAANIGMPIIDADVVREVA